MTLVQPSQTPVPPGTQTQFVSVLPYAYWPLPDRIQYAKFLARARALLPKGLLAGTEDETAARVFLVLETGAALGLQPTSALQGIDIIEGRATISPQLFTGLVRAAGHKLRIRESGTVEGGDLRVDVTLIRTDDPDEPITAGFSLQDALRAGLVDSYEQGTDGVWVVKARSKDNNALPWEKYSPDMCQWRALGRLARRGGADVTMGIGYFPEELEVAVGVDGTRDAESEVNLEDPIIAEFQGLTDKADMAEVWRKYHRVDPDSGDDIVHPGWTERVQAEFGAALLKCTTDSRVRKDGAPGNTGDPDVDAQRALPSGEAPTAPEGAEPAAEPATAPEAVAEPELVPVPATQEPVHAPGHTAADHQPYPDEDPSAGARRLEDLDAQDEDHQLRLDAEAADAAEAAAQQAERGEKRPLDMSALGGPADAPSSDEPF